MQNTFNIDISNKSYNLKVIKRKNCKKITLRVNLKTKQPFISIPYSVTYQEAINFFKINHTWIDNQLNQTNSKYSEYHFANLNEIQVAGDTYKIIKINSKKNNIIINNNNNEIYLELKNINNEEIIEKYFIKFLKKLAKITFYNLSKYKAEQFGVTINKLTVSDTTSKWGSCSSLKNLQYNYRLIMAPVFVIDYVISHEVAHLIELNHSNRFWDIVDNLTPYKNQASDWLKQHGKSLY